MTLLQKRGDFDTPEMHLYESASPTTTP